MHFAVGAVEVEAVDVACAAERQWQTGFAAAFEALPHFTKDAMARCHQHSAGLGA